MLLKIHKFFHKLYSFQNAIAIPIIPTNIINNSMMKFIEKRIDKHIEFTDKHMEFTEEQNYAFQQYVNKENIIAVI